MKTAIICDWLTTIAGAEKVLREMLICFPDADLFSVVDFLDDSQREFIFNKRATTSFIQKLPFAKKKYRSYLPLMPFAIEQFDLSGYDLILSSSHAVAKGVITGPDQVHISYVHSPIRYAWDLQHQYLKESGLDKKWRGLLARYFLHKMRIWDVRSATNVDHLIANSNFIARRINKTYRRNADVIYPPVNIDYFKPHKTKDDFYLTASRFVPYKKIDLIVESFQQMPDKQLIVIGDGPDAKKITAKAGPNVRLLGFQSNDILLDHMQRAKAFIFAAEEDFGIVPVEAQACGTPVIAFGKGGALETVRGLESEKPTGVFFKKQTTNAIKTAVTTFEKQSTIRYEHCVRQASRFSEKTFRKKLMTVVKEKTACYPFAHVN